MNLYHKNIAKARSKHVVIWYAFEVGDTNGEDKERKGMEWSKCISVCAKFIDIKGLVVHGRERLRRRSQAETVLPGVDQRAVGRIP